MGTITLAAHAEGVAPLSMILLNCRARILSPRCTSSFHASAGMSSGPRAFLFFIFLMASWADWLIISACDQQKWEFLIACRVKVLFPASQNGWRFVEESVVSVVNIHYLTNVQGQAMAVVHKFDLAGSFVCVGLGVEVSIVPCLRVLRY